MPNLEHYYKKQLEQLKAQPVKVFALVYPYILVLGLALGVVYVSNMSQVARATVPAGVPDTTKQTDLKVVEPRVVPPLDVNAISQPAPDLVSKGKTIYTTLCQSCHGAEGEGNGPGATGLNPQPRNFTSAGGWKNGQKISGIYKTLQEGIPGSAMVPYDYLLPEEKIGLAHYIRQNFMANPPQDTPDDLTLLDQTYQLSKGQVISAQIPVQMALEIISKQNADSVQRVITILGNMSSDSSNEGAIIFDKVAKNKTQALITLSKSAGWKGNSQQFVNTVASNVNENGFNGQVYNLSSQQWSALQSYLSKYF